jgi:hypothetical protein
MAGDLQTPSGTDFDPYPQFWIDRVEADSAGLLVVIGRCFFGPIRAGLLFDGAVRRRPGGWHQSGLTECCLRVAEIRVFRRLADEIDQDLSARLVLSGEAPAALEADSVLVARAERDEGWIRQGRLWAR